jgi:hypothetical protein
MEELCSVVMESLSPKRLDLLNDGEHFLKLTHNPFNNNTNAQIMEISRENLGDWYESVEYSYNSKQMKGTLIWCLFGHVHELFDYIEENNLIYMCHTYW